MKRVVTIATAAIALAGCQQVITPESGAQQARGTSGFVVTGDRTLIVSLITDPKSGCEYLAVSYRDPAVTPRLDADGKPHCPGASK